jgi:hypothetical protein
MELEPYRIVARRRLEVRVSEEADPQRAAWVEAAWRDPARARAEGAAARAAYWRRRVDKLRRRLREIERALAWARRPGSKATPGEALAAEIAREAAQRDLDLALSAAAAAGVRPPAPRARRRGKRAAAAGAAVAGLRMSRT